MTVSNIFHEGCVNEQIVNQRTGGMPLGACMRFTETIKSEPSR